MEGEQDEREDEHPRELSPATVETLRTFMAAMMALVTAARAPTCAPRARPERSTRVLGVACHAPAPLRAYFARALSAPLEARSTLPEVALTIRWGAAPACRTETLVFRLAWAPQRAHAAQALADMQDALRRAQTLGAALPAPAAGPPCAVAVTARTAARPAGSWARAAAQSWDADTAAHTRVVAVKSVTVDNVRVHVMVVVTTGEG